jgi:hypothetical protein
VIDEADDRRRHRRFTLRKRAALELGSPPARGDGHRVELSETGASLTVPWAVAVGAGIYIQFTLAPDVHCEATGSVIRVFPFGGHHGLAVELGYANPAFIHFLRNLDAAAEAIRPDFLSDIRDLRIHIA